MRGHKENEITGTAEKTLRPCGCRPSVVGPVAHHEVDIQFEEMGHAGGHDRSYVLQLCATVHQGADVEVPEVFVFVHLFVHDHDPAEFFAGGSVLDPQALKPLVIRRIQRIQGAA